MKLESLKVISDCIRHRDNAIIGSGKYMICIIDVGRIQICGLNHTIMFWEKTPECCSFFRIWSPDLIADLFKDTARRFALTSDLSCGVS